MLCGCHLIKMKEYNIINLLVQDSLEQAIKSYGIEGAEDKIKSIYQLMPSVQKFMLEELWKKIKN